MKDQIQEEEGIYLGKYLNSEKIKNQFVSNIKNSLFDLAMSTGIKNNKNFIPLKIIKLISNIVKSELISFVNDNSTKNNLNNKIKN